MKLRALHENVDDFSTNLLMRYAKLGELFSEEWHGEAEPCDIDEIVEFSILTSAKLHNGTFHAPGAGPASKAYGTKEGKPLIFGVSLLPPHLAWVSVNDAAPIGHDGVMITPVSVGFYSPEPKPPHVAWECFRCRASGRSSSRGSAIRLDGSHIHSTIVDAVTHLEEHLYSTESEHFQRAFGTLSKHTYILDKEDGLDGIAKFEFKYKDYDGTVYPIDTTSRFRIEIDEDMTWQVTNLRTGDSKVGKDMHKALNALRFRKIY